MDGDNLIIGAANKSTEVTKLTKDDQGATVVGLEVYNALGTGVRGSSKNIAGIGVAGVANDGTGISGSSKTGIGVRGTTESTLIFIPHPPPPAPPTPQAGVVGSASSAVGVYGISSSGIGVEGDSNTNHGVRGTSNSNDAVHGESGAVGVHGVTTGTTATAIGVMGRVTATTGGAIGVFGTTASPTGQAAFFLGPVSVWGNFTVVGAKSAAVPHPDGSHRLLYALECPESWFEDFGTARLVRGRATVKIDPTFAKLVRTDVYHVFLTPEGDCQGLFVARKSRNGFEVREQQAGRSSLRFSYRLVAKRRDIAGPRLARAKLPKLADLPKVRPVKSKKVARRKAKRR